MDGAAQPKPDSNKMTVEKFTDLIIDDIEHDRLRLPVIPRVAAKIHKVIENPNASANDIAKVLSTDPSLSARILQVANSPLVRGENHIDNLQLAVSRMGNSMIQSTVTSFLVKQLFRSSNTTLQNILNQVWSHSAHVAAICHILARMFTHLKPDEAMLGGLIHDIGKLPILSKAERFPKLASNQELLVKIMKRLHCRLGKTILEAWNFNEHLIAAAADHETLNRDSEKLDIADVVLVANLHSLAGTPQFSAIDWTQIPALKKLDLDPEKSLAVLSEAQGEITQIRKLLEN